MKTRLSGIIQSKTPPFPAGFFFEKYFSTSVKYSSAAV